MKLRIVGLASVVAVLFAVAAFTSNDAKADAPVITITAPTAGTHFVAAFPYATNIAFDVDHNTVNGVNVLGIAVDGVELFEDVGSPFQVPGNNPGCGNILDVPGATCTLTDASNVSATVPWSVPGAGTYTITITARHQGNEGEDEVTATFNLVVAVEFPAPPAVANAHLNATKPKKQLTAGKRGCVVSTIAQRQAHDSVYGPKGGPYDNAMIKSHSDVLFTTCPN